MVVKLPLLVLDGLVLFPGGDRPLVSVAWKLTLSTHSYATSTFQLGVTMDLCHRALLRGDTLPLMIPPDGAGAGGGGGGGGGGGVRAMLAACLRAPPPLQGLFAIMNFPRTMPGAADTALALLHGAVGTVAEMRQVSEGGGGGAGGAAGGMSVLAKVRRCKLKPHDMRVESARLQRLKLSYIICFQVLLANSTSTTTGRGGFASSCATRAPSCDTSLERTAGHRTPGPPSCRAAQWR